MNADGSDRRRLTFTPRIDEQHSSWSPDGTKIAFDTRAGIWVMNTDGGNRRLLVARPGAESPKWSPNGRLIVFDRDQHIGLTSGYGHDLARAGAHHGGCGF